MHYNENSDTVVCFTCKKAHDENKLNADSAFVNRGFSNWKDASKKFNIHQNSNTHREAVLKVVTAPSSMTDVGEHLSSQLKIEKAENRHCFLKILSALKYLARQGIGDDTESNFYQLLLLLAQDDPKLKK